MLCQQDEAIQLLERILRMTETTGETIDQGFDDLEAGQADIEAKLDALTAEETTELAFLATLEQQRGTGQLAPDQQARLDDLKARQTAVSAALDAAREQLAVVDGTEPAPAPVTQPTEPAPAPAPSDTPIADSIPTGDGMASGAAPVVDTTEEPALNES